MVVRRARAVRARAALVISLLLVFVWSRGPAPGALAAGPEVRVTPASATVANGGSVFVDVEAVTPANGLGSWHVELVYTSSVVGSPSCQAFQGSICNTNVSGAPNTIRIVGTSVSGITGTVSLSRITFQGVGSAGSSSVLDLTVVTYTDKDGVDVPRTVTDGLITIPAPPPDLSITKTHSDAFPSGGTGSYSVTVQNAAGAGPTTATTTVTDLLPAQLSFVSASGTGWDCAATVGQNVSCSRPAGLAAGAGAPVLTITVSVACVYGGTSITNTATVATSGETNTSNNSASDPTTITACTTPPADPANLRLGTVTASSIQIQWNDASTNETGFVVVWRPVATPDYRSVNLAANTTSWTHTPLGANESYFYWVQSCINAFCSPLVGAVTGSTAIPGQPSGVHVSSTTTSSITLTWNKPSVAASAYQVVWSPAETASYTFVNLPGNGYTWTHAGLNPGRSYYYWLRACNTIDCSGLAGAVEGISAGGSAPALPTNVRLGITTDSSIQILWNDVASNETSYQVVWSAVPPTAYNFVFLPANTTSYEQTGLPVGTMRYFWVRACISLLCSNFTNAVVGAAYSPPTAPSGLTVGTVTSNTINLTWTDNASNELAIEVVWNQAGAGSYITQSFPPNTQSWAHSGLSSSTTYYHWARACRGPVCSAYTSVATATTTGAGGAPLVQASGSAPDSGRAGRVPPPPPPAGPATGWSVDPAKVPPPPTSAPALPPPSFIPGPGTRGAGTPPSPTPTPPPSGRGGSPLPVATPTPTPIPPARGR